MDKLYIAETVESPEIDFDPITNTLKMKGMSYPDNSFEFYIPIIKWLKQYFNSLKKSKKLTQIEIDITYMNTSSTKCMFDILDIFEIAHQHKFPLVLRWYYEDGNEELKECAVEFQEDYDFDFKIIPK